MTRRGVNSSGTRASLDFPASTFEMSCHSTRRRASAGQPLYRADLLSAFVGDRLEGVWRGLADQAIAHAVVDPREAGNAVTRVRDHWRGFLAAARTRTPLMPRSCTL